MINHVKQIKFLLHVGTTWRCECERVPHGSAAAACMLLLRAKRVSPKGEGTAQEASGMAVVRGSRDPHSTSAAFRIIN